MIFRRIRPSFFLLVFLFSRLAPAQEITAAPRPDDYALALNRDVIVRNLEDLATSCASQSACTNEPIMSAQCLSSYVDTPMRISWCLCTQSIIATISDCGQCMIGSNLVQPSVVSSQISQWQHSCALLQAEFGSGPLTASPTDTAASLLSSAMSPPAASTSSLSVNPGGPNLPMSTSLMTGSESTAAVASTTTPSTTTNTVASTAAASTTSTGIASHVSPSRTMVVFLAFILPAIFVGCK